MTVAASTRRCYYCGEPGASVALVSQARGAVVWTCSNQHACTARARALTAKRINAPSPPSAA